jgi:anti-sigma regulatory factor (Ser/Thr protein kinase)
MTGQLAERFETRLPRTAAAPSVARGFLRAWAGGTLPADRLDTARLLVSELVTNAVLHGRGEVNLRAWLRPDALRVEVRDQGGAFAHEGRRPNAPMAGGWGLQMVSMQSSRWGVSSECARVWFELDLHEAPATPNGSASSASTGRPRPRS